MPFCPNVNAFFKNFSGSLRLSFPGIGSWCRIRVKKRPGRAGKSFLPRHLVQGRLIIISLYCFYPTWSVHGLFKIGIIRQMVCAEEFLAELFQGPILFQLQQLLVHVFPKGCPFLGLWKQEVCIQLRGNFCLVLITKWRIL
jgi:hypothetical protein